MTGNIQATFAWLRKEGFMIDQLNILREDLIAALEAERYRLISFGVDETDVRLVIYHHDVCGTVWDIKTGDVGYDTEHGIACGASMIGQYDTNDAIRETADDLISQVEDQWASERARTGDSDE